MALSKLEKAKWRTFFDRVSKQLVGKRAEIEVESLALGTQVGAKWVPLLGIVHDPKSDIIEIVLRDMEHVVQKPRQVYIDEGPTGLLSFEVLDRDGVQHIVQFRDPLTLPPPAVGQKASLAAQQNR